MSDMKELAAGKGEMTVKEERDACEKKEKVFGEERILESINEKE